MWFHLLLLVILGTQFTATSPPWPPKIGLFEQKVTHFHFAKDSPTFQQRFVYEDKWYEAGGPVFFYCGNEGDILAFWNNTGLLFEIAPSFKALVIFAEHRYYGESLPFESSFVQPFIQFLSIQEALADFADLIPEVKARFNASKSPVIAFGGSYGGMLAAYMRLHYPYIVEGAIASSAPMKWVTGEEPLHPFFESIKETYFSANEYCIPVLQTAYKMILNEAATGIIGLKNISTQMHLCEPMQDSTDLDWMLRWSRNAFVMIGMMDYPYATSFMGSLPANPANVSCERAARLPDDPIAGLREAVAVFYNISSEKCFDYKSQYIDCADITGCGLGNDSIAWDFQACTEIHLYDASNATSSDIFPSLPKTLEENNRYCYEKFGVKLAEKQLLTAFGPISAWKRATNIVFSNGNLDPWMGGGILENLSKTVIALQIHGGAHHLDLRESNPADPPSVKIARQAEFMAISAWLKSYDDEHFNFKF